MVLITLRLKLYVPFLYHRYCQVLIFLFSQSYRAEQFRRAADIYEKLAQGDTSHEANDLSINSWATDAQLQWKGESEHVRHERPSREDLESFETSYNAACLNIAKGQLRQGEVLLNRAKSEIFRGNKPMTVADL